LFRKGFKSEIIIDAPAERIWEILTDFGSYEKWNPMIRRASGQARVGARLKVHFEPEGRKGSNFRPKLTIVDPNRELRWLGWPRFPFVFDMDHYWLLEGLGNGRIRLEHGAVAYGLAVPFIGNVMVKSFREPFEAMNRAMKERAEGARG
jgi:hypothetical protein